jgi:hypothetical protein
MYRDIEPLIHGEPTSEASIFPMSSRRLIGFFLGLFNHEDQNIAPAIFKRKIGVFIASDLPRSKEAFSGNHAERLYLIAGDHNAYQRIAAA